MNDIIQLKISLQDSKPPIWRRILIDKDATFFELHQIIQIVMGWHNSHLHQFEIGQRIIGEYEEKTENSFFYHEVEDEKKIRLSELTNSPKTSFKYIYDMGDYWQHKILVENFLPRESLTQYPSCIKGKLNCPPEDCGGIYGFYELLEILADSKHPEYKSMRKWVGKDYSPELFDMEYINQSLK